MAEFSGAPVYIDDSGSIFICNYEGLTMKNPRLSLSGPCLFSEPFWLDPSFFAVKAPPTETSYFGFSSSVLLNIFSSNFLWNSGSLSMVFTFGVIRVDPRPFLAAVS